MLTEAQVTAGTARLLNGKLKASDIESLLSIFRGFLGSLETGYSYNLESVFTALDDTAGQKKTAAKLAACLTLTEEIQFGVSALKPINSRNNSIDYSEKEERYAIFLYAFGLLFPIPLELSEFNDNRRTHRAGYGYAKQIRIN